MIFLIMILGGFMNRIRGGWLNTGLSDILNAAAFGALYSALTLSWVGILAGIGMYVGSLSGWGRYIGYMGGIRGNWDTHKGREEVRWIDRVLSKSPLSDRWWGFCGLAIRGLFWGACIAALTLNPWALIGVTMPICYFIGISLEQVIRKIRGGFEYGEIIFGSVLWTFVFYPLL